MFILTCIHLYININFLLTTLRDALMLTTPTHSQSYALNKKHTNVYSTLVICAPVCLSACLSILFILFTYSNLEHEETDCLQRIRYKTIHK